MDYSSFGTHIRLNTQKRCYGKQYNACDACETCHVYLHAACGLEMQNAALRDALSVARNMIFGGEKRARSAMKEVKELSEDLLSSLEKIMRVLH